MDDLSDGYYRRSTAKWPGFFGKLIRGIIPGQVKFIHTFTVTWDLLVVAISHVRSSLVLEVRYKEHAFVFLGPRRWLSI